MPTSASKEDSEIVFDNSEPELSEGDYFLYDVDLTGMRNQMIEDSDGEIVEVVENSNSGMNLSHSGNSCESDDGSECFVGAMDWAFNFTIYYASGSGIDNDESIMEMNMHGTVTGNDLENWDETTSRLDMWFSLDGTPYHLEQHETENTHEIQDYDFPDKIAVGDTWTTVTSSDTTTDSKERINGGDWDYNSTNDSDEETENYIAESVANVYIKGESHTALKITSQIIGEEDYESVYINQNGMPIKMEIYTNGTLDTIMTLNDYQWLLEPKDSTESTDDSSDELLPGFSSLIGITALVAASLSRKQE